MTSERVDSKGGEYSRSFGFELLPGPVPVLRFGNSAPHAIYVEEDTVAHDVRPVQKRALRWFDPPGGGEGAAVFSQFARIPARTGKHVVRDAVSRAADSLRET